MQETLKATHAKGVDLVVSTTGPACVDDNVQLLRRRGSVALVGFLNPARPVIGSNVFMNLLFKGANAM